MSGYVYAFAIKKCHWLIGFCFKFNDKTSYAFFAWLNFVFFMCNSCVNKVFLWNLILWINILRKDWTKADRHTIQPQWWNSAIFVMEGKGQRAIDFCLVLLMAVGRSEKNNLHISAWCWGLIMWKSQRPAVIVLTAYISQ